MGPGWSLGASGTGGIASAQASASGTWSGMLMLGVHIAVRRRLRAAMASRTAWRSASVQWLRLRELWTRHRTRQFRGSSRSAGSSVSGMT
jgi:hypothetical protein